jgi:hypothetical protein
MQMVLLSVKIFYRPMIKGRRRLKARCIILKVIFWVRIGCAFIGRVGSLNAPSSALFGVSTDWQTILEDMNTLQANWKTKVLLFMVLIGVGAENQKAPEAMLLPTKP